MLPSAARNDKKRQRLKGAGPPAAKPASEAAPPAPPRPVAYCCGCHESVVAGKPNLPLGRSMCQECIDSVLCYVCSSKRIMEQEEEQLLMCDNCRWRGAHHRCLGFKVAPHAPWYCFRCEDPKTRSTQREVLPVLDSRVHDEYLATAFPRKRAASLQQSDSADFEEEMVGTGGMAPSAGAAPSPNVLATYVARPDLDMVLHDLVELHVKPDGPRPNQNAAGERVWTCFKCSEPHRVPFNFCSACGSVMAISRDFTDRAATNDNVQPGARRHVFISYRGVVCPSIAVYDTGEVRLAQVANLQGRLMSLVLARDSSTVRWVLEDGSDDEGGD